MINNIEAILETKIDRFYNEIVIHKKKAKEEMSILNSAASGNSVYAVLFADFGGSTELVDCYDSGFSTWLLKSYLTCVSSIIRHYGGEITAFEGDGIMAIFSSTDKESQAVLCSFSIQWAVTNIIQPKIDCYFPELSYKMHHVVGIDLSELNPVKTEIWDNYDILWIGRAANYSANLTRINNHKYSTYITENIYTKLSSELRNIEKNLIWEELEEKVLNIRVYRSNSTVTLQ